MEIMHRKVGLWVAVTGVIFSGIGLYIQHSIVGKFDFQITPTIDRSIFGNPTAVTFKIKAWKAGAEPLPDARIRIMREGASKHFPLGTGQIVDGAATIEIKNPFGIDQFVVQISPPGMRARSKDVEVYWPKLNKELEIGKGLR